MDAEEKLGRDANPLSQPAWLVTFGALGLFFAVWLYSLWPTVISMKDIWDRSETYTHGYLILPISIWLVWYRRHELAQLVPGVALLPLFFVAGSLLLWALARLTGVLVVEQFAAITVLTTAIWALLGHRVTIFLAFPILFLYLAVPMGEDLIQPMMEFTATFTVWMLRVTDVPVFREGLHFVIPTGRWSVVEACSGVRYIIASVTLGVLYAYITYNSLGRRLAFILLSALVPVIANGLRAYMIVMLGHLSGNTLAVGVDHLVYGWVFFGLVMLLLFWIGSFWSEPVPDSSGEGVSRSDESHDSGGGQKVTSLLIVGTVAIVLTILAPTALNARLSGTSEYQRVSTLPLQIGEWQQQSPTLQWTPRITGARQILHAGYDNGRSVVEVYIGVYPVQKQGSEAVTSVNLAVNEDSGWLIKSRHAVALQTASGGIKANGFTARRGHPGTGSSNGQLEVLQWYRVGSKNESNVYAAKVFEALNVLLHGRTDVMFVAIASSVEGDQAQSSAAHKRFVNEVYPELELILDQALLPQ